MLLIGQDNYFKQKYVK